MNKEQYLKSIIFSIIEDNYGNGRLKVIPKINITYDSLQRTYHLKVILGNKKHNATISIDLVNKLNKEELYNHFKTQIVGPNPPRWDERNEE